MIFRSSCHRELCSAILRSNWILYEQVTRDGKPVWEKDNRKHIIKHLDRLSVELTLNLAGKMKRRDPIYKLGVILEINATDEVIEEKAESMPFVVNSPPFTEDGEKGCHIEPKQGKAITTNFTVTCLGWKDEDQPLSFELRYTTNTGLTVIIQSDNPTKLTTSLPIGKNLSLPLWIKIRDSLGASVRDLVKPKVRTLPIKSLSVYEQTDNRTDGQPNRRTVGQADRHTSK